MKLQDTVTGLEVMDRAQCLDLLAQRSIGRLGVIDGGRPLVLPVNYALFEGDVVFRTDDGTKRRAATRAPVAFEVDHFDEEARCGWSIVVSGRGEEIAPASVEAARLAADDRVDCWADGEHQHWVRIVASSVTGRRVRC